jgi:hypothetical protein
MWKTVTTIAIVTVGVRGLAATRGDAPIFSAGVSQTNNPV